MRHHMKWHLRDTQLVEFKDGMQSDVIAWLLEIDDCVTSVLL